MRLLLPDIPGSERTPLVLQLVEIIHLQQERIQQLEERIQQLEDEIARLKGVGRGQNLSHSGGQD